MVIRIKGSSLKEVTFRGDLEKMEGFQQGEIERKGILGGENDESKGLKLGKLCIHILGNTKVDRSMDS